jgi:hypothetical protein
MYHDDKIETLQIPRSIAMCGSMANDRTRRDVASVLLGTTVDGHPRMDGSPCETPLPDASPNLNDINPMPILNHTYSAYP